MSLNRILHLGDPNRILIIHLFPVSRIFWEQFVEMCWNIHRSYHCEVNWNINSYDTELWEKENISTKIKFCLNRATAGTMSGLFFSSVKEFYLTEYYFKLILSMLKIHFTGRCTAVSSYISMGSFGRISSPHNFLCVEIFTDRCATQDSMVWLGPTQGCDLLIFSSTRWRITRIHQRYLQHLLLPFPFHVFLGNAKRDLLYHIVSNVLKYPQIVALLKKLEFNTVSG